MVRCRQVRQDRPKTRPQSGFRSWVRKRESPPRQSSIPKRARSLLGSRWLRCPQGKTQRGGRPCPPQSPQRRIPFSPDRSGQCLGSQRRDYSRITFVDQGTRTQEPDCGDPCRADHRALGLESQGCRSRHASLPQAGPQNPPARSFPRDRAPRGRGHGHVRGFLLPGLSR